MKIWQQTWWSWTNNIAICWGAEARPHCPVPWTRNSMSSANVWFKYTFTRLRI